MGVSSQSAISLLSTLNVVGYGHGGQAGFSLLSGWEFKTAR